jgi:hypothetical protein
MAILAMVPDVKRSLRSKGLPESWSNDKDRYE